MKTRKAALLVCLGITLAFFTVNARFVSAQDDNQAKREKAFNLLKQNNFTDALPLLEELAKTNTGDPEILYYAGYLTFTNAQNIKDVELRKKAALKARDYLLRARQLGVDNVLMRNMLGGIAADGTIDQLKFSNNVEADPKKASRAAILKPRLKTMQKLSNSTRRFMKPRFTRVIFITNQTSRTRRASGLPKRLLLTRIGKRLIATGATVWQRKVKTRKREKSLSRLTSLSLTVNSRRRELLIGRKQTAQRSGIRR